MEKQYLQQIEDDRAFHEQKEEERVTAEVKDRKEKEENRVRMGRMESSRDEFLEQIRRERHEAHLVSPSHTCVLCVCCFILQLKLKEFEATLEVARMERMKKRKQERKAKRKAEAAALKIAEEEKIC